MIGSPLAKSLMDHFHTATSVGVTETFVTMGIVYWVFMMFGAITVRLPPPDWQPEGYSAPAQPKKLVTTAQVTADRAVMTPQFYLLWGFSFSTVTAGIGVLSQASPMIQEMFPGAGCPRPRRRGSSDLSRSSTWAGEFPLVVPLRRARRRRTYMIYFSARSRASIRSSPRREGWARSSCSWPGYITVIMSIMRRRIRHDSSLPSRPLRDRAGGRDCTGAS